MRMIEYKMIEYINKLAELTAAEGEAQSNIAAELIENYEKLLAKLREARAELPCSEKKRWTLEVSFPMELNVTVRANLAKAEPMTRDYPGSPAHIEDLELLIEGCGITQTLYNKLTTQYEDEIEEQVWDEADAMAEDMAQAEAEHRMEAAEHRRDLMEGR